MLCHAVPCRTAFLCRAAALATSQPSPTRRARHPGSTTATCQPHCVPAALAPPCADWLEDRLDSVYKQHPGYSDKASTLFTIDLGAPEELPDALRGEKWSFVQLPLGTLQQVRCGTAHRPAAAAARPAAQRGVARPSARRNRLLPCRLRSRPDAARGSEGRGRLARATQLDFITLGPAPNLAAGTAGLAQRCYCIQASTPPCVLCRRATVPRRSWPR